MARAQPGHDGSQSAALIGDPVAERSRGAKVKDDMLNLRGLAPRRAPRRVQPPVAVMGNRTTQLRDNLHPAPRILTSDFRVRSGERLQNARTQPVATGG